MREKLSQAIRVAMTPTFVLDDEMFENCAYRLEQEGQSSERSLNEAAGTDRFWTAALCVSRPLPGASAWDPTSFSARAAGANR